MANPLDIIHSPPARRRTTKSGFFEVDTNTFFDSEKVAKGMKRSTNNMLRRFGAAVRLTAKRSIVASGKRQRARVKKLRQSSSKKLRARADRIQRSLSATPGNPPKTHTGILKRSIFFRADRRKFDVVIGPVPVRLRNRRYRQDVIATRLLEHSGSVRVTLSSSSFTPIGGVSRKKKVIKRRYRKFPYMTPARDKMINRMPRDWKRLLHRA